MLKNSKEQRHLAGRLGEEAVCVWLEEHGFYILYTNFSIKGGEIDIIATDNKYLAFVEVKARRCGSMISGREAVTRLKQRRIITTAYTYLNRYPSDLQPRFDVAEVELDGKGCSVLGICYIDNAFDISAMSSNYEGF